VHVSEDAIKYKKIKKEGNDMKRLLKVIAAITMLTMIVATVAFAAVVYEVGPNKVTNTERYQYIYDGYGQVQGSYRVGEYRYYQVYIRYSGGADGDTGRLYSPESLDETIASVSHTYTDTLNPFAPKVTFNYGFEKSLWNIMPSILKNPSGELPQQ